MAEGPNRTNRNFAWLRSKKVRGPQMVRVIATMVVSLAVLALSKCVFHSDLRLGEIVLFGTLMGVLAFVLDRSEPEKLVAQNALPPSGKLLEQSQKMEAIGRLAGGVAHDFNNLLAVIIGYSDLLLESLGSSDLNRAKVEQIKQAASSAASLTRQLLTFSRQQVILPEVTDTGTGMDQHTQAHIFEPFFTTKAVGEGSGLGLATVYAIVKQSNGHIEVQSTLGQGSSFKIYLPATKQAGADHESGKETARLAFSGATVLVVEDAQPLRDVICETLRASGCTVLSARDGQEALRMVGERKSAFDLLLTDVIMPGMNGPALAKEVRSLRPQTKILYMTGYSGEFIQADMLTPGVSFIQKPFTSVDLERKIGKMLADKLRENSPDSTASPKTTSAPKALAARTSG